LTLVFQRNDARVIYHGTAKRRIAFDRALGAGTLGVSSLSQVPQINAAKCTMPEDIIAL
jgi:hypothetical protein